MERCEAELCRSADLVLASAEDLAERCRAYGARAELSDILAIFHPLEGPALNVLCSGVPER
jgi:hypothetical protein